MKRLLVVLWAFALLASGCGISVVPQAAGSAVLGADPRSLTAAAGEAVVTARLLELEVAPYRLTENIASFYVIVENRSKKELSLPLDSYELYDGEGISLPPIDPSEIHALVSGGSQYLIPYPYVGYYYLEDDKKSAFSNTFESALPFYAENHPGELLAEALPAGPIPPGGRVSGALYFAIDLYVKKYVELRAYLPGSEKSAPADFVLPFIVEKR